MPCSSWQMCSRRPRVCKFISSHGMLRAWSAVHVTTMLTNPTCRRRLQTSPASQSTIPRTTRAYKQWRIRRKHHANRKCSDSNHTCRSMGTCSGVLEVSALEVIFNVMRSMNPRFTYLLTYVPFSKCEHWRRQLWGTAARAFSTSNCCQVTPDLFVRIILNARV